MVMIKNFYVKTIELKKKQAIFLVIRNDSIIYERYSMGITEHSLLPSNSMAKSFIGTLTGIALYEGKIQSDSEPITNYLPELAKEMHASLK
jgi:CubicO group peptidase (beta-lactamase class C family)